MIQKMSYSLTNEALDTLRKDTSLCIEVAKDLGVSPYTIPSMITRKSRRLTENVVASKIAERMGKSALDIIVGSMVAA